MREILFKGKRKDNGEWIEGSSINTQYDVSGKKHIYIGIPVISEMYPLMQTIEWIEVIPETVGQYIGKELCNEKLFEGDIVEWYEDYDDSFGYPQTAIEHSVVVWNSEDYCWAFKTDNEYIPLFNDWNWEDCFIIGNIHDNPELLKGEEEDE